MLPPHRRLHKQLLQYYIYYYSCNGFDYFKSWQKSTHDETYGANNAVSCYKEALHYSQCFLYITVCQFLTKFVKWQ